MIVLDANILIRAVLGQRVGQRLEQYSQQGIRFYAPETAYGEAEEYLAKAWTIPVKEYSTCVIFGAMHWDVEFTEEFETWWNLLSQQEQEELAAKVELLEEHGPNLGRPHADVITSSRHSNMKELRGKVRVSGKDRYLRVLFAFDPLRTALLLIGGDKTDDPGWYEKSVPVADDIFDKHLKELDRQKKKSEGKGRNKSATKN